MGWSLGASGRLGRSAKGRSGRSSPSSPLSPLSSRIATLLFSSLLGSTFLAACLVAVPLAVHFLYEKPDPTEHRKYVSVSRTSPRSPPPLVLTPLRFCREQDNIGAWFYFAASNILVSWYLAVAVSSPFLPRLAVWTDATNADRRPVFIVRCPGRLDPCARHWSHSHLLGRGAGEREGVYRDVRSLVPIQPPIYSAWSSTQISSLASYSNDRFMVMKSWIKPSQFLRLCPPAARVGS